MRIAAKLPDMFFYPSFKSMTFSVSTQLSKHHVLEKQEKGNHADEDLSALFERL